LSFIVKAFIHTFLLNMKVNVLLAGVLGASAVAASRQFNFAKMEKMMSLKTQQWAEAAANGLFAGSKKYKKSTGVTKCVNGYAGDFMCNNVDMTAFLSHEDLGSKTLAGNDVWGWTSATGREFGIVGQTDGVAFVEIVKDGSLVYIGRLDTFTTPTSWRDMKVIKNHVYIGSEATGHGLQIFDLRKLLKVNPKFPRVFLNALDLTAHYAGFGASHNIVAHEETDMIYAVGGQNGANSRNTPCAGGLFMVDVSNPAKPTSPGCVGAGGYVHDAQCVIYKGPTTEYLGKEICFGYNEDTLTIYDVTDKSAVAIISETPYVGNAYTHQGWLIDDSMTHLLLDDELDELEGAGPPGGEIGGSVNRTTVSSSTHHLPFGDHESDMDIDLPLRRLQPLRSQQHGLLPISRQVHRPQPVHRRRPVLPGQLRQRPAHHRRQRRPAGPNRRQHRRDGFLRLSPRRRFYQRRSCVFGNMERISILQERIYPLEQHRERDLRVEV
jgi:choice-of-anchor B domain-containing protein